VEVRSVLAQVVAQVGGWEPERVLNLVRVRAQAVALAVGLEWVRQDQEWGDRVCDRVCDQAFRSLLVRRLAQRIRWELRLDWVLTRVQLQECDTTIGYVINTAAIPLLAFTNHWESAAVLLIAERAGRAVRSPPRDVLLSHAASQVGGGFGFGLHEALDQIGAVAGPLAVAGMLAWQQNYQRSFAILVIPALVELGVLLVIQRRYPNPQEFEADRTTTLPRHFWIYWAGVMLVGFGFADFPLIAFHWQNTNLIAATTIPLFYAVAMAMDAIAALLLGR
ncbi:MAG: MFS transporter, partial [Leptolyngbyaceae cyanobacterium SM1_3_5]|nr:MFS transporter [Leptolyngbyaceae cyanobacterium SM1_3_5]